MRIDRSDPADGAGDAHMIRRALLAPDDPGVTGKAASGDGPPDSQLARPDSATRTAYRAEVNAVNRQYAIDHGYAGVEKPSEGGDVPDDPRNYSNPKTGRFDASWSRYVDIQVSDYCCRSVS